MDLYPYWEIITLNELLKENYKKLISSLVGRNISHFYKPENSLPTKTESRNYISTEDDHNFGFLIERDLNYPRKTTKDSRVSHFVEKKR